ncbi:hypothetical protein LCGC14_0788580 [marine sediment metagenome]|uniref:Uncharacterized protein n=1 Tax=marine sediment metagenome TaxID=412755 RepID=A0A0F9QD10_9ZZZZ
MTTTTNDITREEVVKDISRSTAAYIMRETIKFVDSVDDIIDVAHDVIRHLNRKLNVEV